MALKVTKRMQMLRAAYLGDARGDRGMACQMAGYKIPKGCSPAQPWSVIKRRNPKWIEALEEEFKDSMIMKGREIDERLTALARDPSHRDHYKALESLAKMHGKFKDTVIVIDRKKLDSEFDELVSTMLAAKTAQQAPNKVLADN